MTLDRRTLLAATAGLATAPALALPPSTETAPHWPPAEHFALWPGDPPGTPAVPPTPKPEITGKPGEYHDIWMRHTARPDVGVFRAAKPDGRALLIAPGGGYAFVSLRNEGTDPAAIFAAHGITCFVLNYRLPGDGWADRANTPLADAQRAMRLIRSQAKRYAVDPARIGVLGFSAGGHLAASLATQHGASVYTPVDAADTQSARPAFAGLLYAVSNMDAGRSHGGSRTQLLGPDPSPTMEARYAADRNVTRDTPPLFIAHAIDDTTVPVANSLDLFAAARAATIRTEAHFFERGGHGFGTHLPDTLPGSQWPALFTRWLDGIV